MLARCPPKIVLCCYVLDKVCIVQHVDGCWHECQRVTHKIEVEFDPNPSKTALHLAPSAATAVMTASVCTDPVELLQPAAYSQFRGHVLVPEVWSICVCVRSVCWVIFGFARSSNTQIFLSIVSKSWWRSVETPMSAILFFSSRNVKETPCIVLSRTISSFETKKNHAFCRARLEPNQYQVQR
jgi:hypothetical protein